MLAPHFVPACFFAVHGTDVGRPGQTICFIPAMHVGTTDFYNYIQLSLTLTLPGSQKISVKQNLLTSFSPTPLHDKMWYDGKEIKLNILTQPKSEIYINLGNNCCFTDVCMQSDVYVFYTWILVLLTLTLIEPILTKFSYNYQICSISKGANRTCVASFKKIYIKT